MIKSFIINPNINLGHPIRNFDLKFKIKQIFHQIYIFFIRLNIRISKPDKIYCTTEIFNKLNLKNDIKYILFDKDIVKKKEKTNFKLIRQNINKIYNNKKNTEKYEDFFITRFYEKKWLDQLFLNILLYTNQINFRENLFIFGNTQFENFISTKKPKLQKSKFFFVTNIISKIFYLNKSIKKKLEILANKIVKNSYKYNFKKKNIPNNKKKILIYCRIERDFEKIIPLINHCKEFFFCIMFDDLERYRFQKNYHQIVKKKIINKNYAIYLISSLIKEHKKSNVSNKINYYDDIYEKYIYFIYYKFHSLTINYIISLNNLFKNLKPDIYIALNDTDFSSVTCHVANKLNIKSIYLHTNSPDSKTSLYDTEFRYLLSPGRVINKNMKDRFKNRVKKLVGVPIKIKINQNDKIKFLKKNKLIKNTKIIGFFSKKMSHPYSNQDLIDFFHLIAKNSDDNTKILLRQHPLVDINILQSYLPKFKDKVMTVKNYSLDEYINICDFVCSFTSTVFWPVMLKRIPVVTYLNKDIISNYEAEYFHIKDCCLNLKNSKNVKKDLEMIQDKSNIMRKSLIKNSFKLAKSHFSYTDKASLNKIKKFITNIL